MVAFAGRGVVRCPLTANLDAAVDALRSLRPGDVQPGGTDLGAALDAAIGAFDDEEHAEGRTIVVFSDGEDHVGSWASAIDRLKAAGIIVHCGRDRRPGPGPPGPRRSAESAEGRLARRSRPGGRTSPSRRSPRRPAARWSRSAWPRPTSARSSATGSSRPPGGVRDELRLAERVERFPAFLLAALGLGLAGSWPGLARRRGRRLAFAALAVAAIWPSASGPAGRAAAEAWSREGRSAYEAGRFAEALGAFERAIALDPAAADPPLRRRLGPVPAPPLPRGHRPLRGGPRPGRRRAGDQDRLRPGQRPPGAGRRRRGRSPATTPAWRRPWPAPAFDAVRRDAAANRDVRRAPDSSRPPEDARRRGSSPPGREAAARGPAKRPRGDGDPDAPARPAGLGPGADGPPASPRPGPPRGRAAPAGGRGERAQAPPRADRPRPGSTRRSRTSARPRNGGRPDPPRRRLEGGRQGLVTRTADRPGLSGRSGRGSGGPRRRPPRRRW